jgi:hypothetical protein
MPLEAASRLNCGMISADDPLQPFGYRLTLPNCEQDEVRFLLILLGLFGIADAAESPTQFRGFSYESECPDVIDAELTAGGQFVRTDIIEEHGVEFTVTQISTTIYSFNALAIVSCLGESEFYSIDYVVGDNDPLSTSAIATAIVDQVSGVFGKPMEASDSFEDEGRVVHFQFGLLGHVIVYEGNQNELFGIHNVVLRLCPKCSLFFG